MPDSSDEQLLDTIDVAVKIKAKEGTLERWRQIGIGPDYIRVGRLIRYKQSAIDRWLSDQTVAIRD